jgi:Xaa-Pro dipeptidase
MLNRRSFLLAATAPAILPALLKGALPPAIEKLKNRRSEAKPIPQSELEARVERARALLAENKLDAVVLAGGTSLRYFTGVRWGNSERLFAWVLPRKGQPFFVSPAFEEDRAREQAGSTARVMTWQEDESPFALISAGLNASTGRIGIEEKVVFSFSDGIAQANKGFEIASAVPVVSACRARKTPAEIALMRLANNVTLDAYKAAWASVQEGMTNRDLGSLIATAMERQGFPGFASVQVGEWAALPHGSGRPQVIREGSLVMMDDGCTVEGYQADVTRTVVLGKPTDKMNRVFDIVFNAQKAALAAAKPGAPCESVDSAARKVITAGGYGPGYKYFTHRLGHGIGMDGHEWPYLVNGNKLPLASGMTFSDEPGIYIPGEFGVRCEDIMAITDTGSEMLTPAATSLEKM